MIAPRLAAAPPGHEEAPEDAEEYLDSLYRAKAPLVPKAEAVQPVAHPASPENPVGQRTINVEQLSSLSQVWIKQNQQKASAVVDQKKAQRDCEKIRTKICGSYNNSPPTDVVKDFPELCERIKAENACAASAQ